MPQLGIPEIFVILVVALVVFGPQRLPEIARQVGKALAEVRKVQAQFRTQFDDVIGDLDPRSIIEDGPVDRTPPGHATQPTELPDQREPHVSSIDPGAARTATSRFRPPTAQTPPLSAPSRAPTQSPPAAGSGVTPPHATSILARERPLQGHWRPTPPPRPPCPSWNI